MEKLFGLNSQKDIFFNNEAQQLSNIDHLDHDSPKDLKKQKKKWKDAIGRRPGGGSAKR